MVQIRIEVWLASGYSIFLLVVAAFLEQLALCCYRRSHRIHTSGFTYRQELDAWECPAHQLLTRSAVNSQTMLVIYRAPAGICTGCDLKPTCTDSDRGREIAGPPDKWLQSEIGRFHRGLSLSLCVLAAFLLTVEVFRSQAFAETVLLTSMLVLIGTFGTRLAAELRTA